MSPSLSKSAPAIPVHQPVRFARSAFWVSLTSFPLSLRNSFTEPHSVVSSRSGQPSPVASDHRHPVTIPISDKFGAIDAVTSTNLPPLLRYRLLLPGRGYLLGICLPPMKRSTSPSRSKSAAAIGPDELSPEGKGACSKRAPPTFL